MYTKKLIGTSLVLAFLTSTAVALDNFKQVGTEAGWDIYVREGKARGCLIAKELTDDTQFQMGINPAEQIKGFMALYTRAGAEISAGEKVSVIFDVDGQKFTGEATGQQLEGFKGAYVQFNNPEFIYDLAKKKMLTITPEGRDPIKLSLTGTDAAFKALRMCQEAAQ